MENVIEERNEGCVLSAGKGERKQESDNDWTKIKTMQETDWKEVTTRTTTTTMVMLPCLITLSVPVQTVTL
jgi:hypothetical protein